MDSPQVPENRARKPVPNDGMANKVAKLEAENKQAKTTDKQKRTLKAKIPTLVEVSELRTKIGMLEKTKWELVKLMPHIIKDKMAELKRQVESGNPDYNDISWMGCQFKSLLHLLPKCARIAMVAHFSTQYTKLKRLSRTYIKARQWAKIERQLGYLTDSERVYSNNIQIRSDVLTNDVENRLGKLFETYQARFDTAGSGSQQARNEEDAVKSQGKNDFFANYLHVEGHTSVAMETELLRYLHEPEVNFQPGFDILKWWSLNGNRFPIVAHMARDILAIQISSVASESAFSTVGCVLDPYRTRLSTNILEALICTQDWVRKSSNSIYMDQVDDILNDDDIAIEIEEAINNQKDKGKEPMLVEE